MMKHDIEIYELRPEDPEGFKVTPEFAGFTPEFAGFIRDISNAVKAYCEVISACGKALIESVNETVRMFQDSAAFEIILDSVKKIVADTTRKAKKPPRAYRYPACYPVCEKPQEIQARRDYRVRCQRGM